MNSATELAQLEGFSDASERRKRLGQYFSGLGLARLLAALADATHARTIIDPMGGTGDMLAGCLSLGANPRYFGAVEIDPEAHDVCRNRLPLARVLLGNAFDISVLSDLPCSEWDLVITNPPYVRYQSMSRAAGNEFKLPDADSIRKGLINALDFASALDETDRALFKLMASSYSGLADLAVPAWILSASMVSMGGRLALVVPESWLSRDYAAIVHYLLLRWFHIEYLIEDEHAVWFEGAQVKTTLIVARRVHRKESFFDWGSREFFVKGRISGKAARPDGPISGMFSDVDNPEFKFVALAKNVLNSGGSIDSELYSLSPVAFARVATNLGAVCSRQKWFSHFGETFKGCVSSLPDALVAWLGSEADVSFDTLESLGVSVGQGLRTGANSFFYVTLLANERLGTARVSTSIPGVDEMTLPAEVLRPVLRKQSELPADYVVKSERLLGRVLDLRRYALLEDILVGGEAAKNAYTQMPEGLAYYVRTAKVTNVGSETDPKYVPELSAVAPNIRKGDPVLGVAPRFWYMLPDFTARHTPDLILPRVNGGKPKAWIVDEGVLVDANFVTLTLGQERKFDRYSLLAFLNSAWCRAVLENVASVMGGGALKVEAAHLRRTPVPKFSAQEWRALSDLGRKASEGKMCMEEVDSVVVSAIRRKSADEKDVASLLVLAEEGKARRDGHKKKRHV